MYVHDRPLQIELTSRGEATVCRLAGAATMETCSLLNERLVEAGDRAGKLLLIDLGELDFISSLGLGSLVAAYLRANRRNSVIRLAAPQPAIRELLEVTRLDTLLPVFDSVEEAIVA